MKVNDVQKLGPYDAKSIVIGKQIARPAWEIEHIAKHDSSNLTKEDTSYYNNPLYKMIEGYFNVNPIYVDPILSQFGALDTTDMNPNDRYIQYEAVVAKSNGVVSDDLVFSRGDSKIFPAIRKTKFFQYGVFLTELQKKALDAGGRSGNLVAAKVDAEIQASQGLMVQNALKWLLHYQVLTSEPEYDPDWHGFLEPQAATGTASTPEPIASTPQTATAIALNFTGTNKSKDFISGVFGQIQENFRAQRDSTTGEQLLLGQMGNNSWLHLLNPANVKLMKETHPYNGVQDDQNITYFQQIQNLEGRHNLMGSYDIDAAHSVAEDGTNVIGSILNPSLNFKIAYQVPFISEGWREAWMGSQFGYIKRAYMKIGAWVRPYYIGGSWVKAFDHNTYVYKNDA